MSDWLKKEYRLAFTVYDKDGDSRISRTDLKKALKEINFYDPSELEFDFMIRKFNTYGEFCFEFRILNI